jgi:hypothetical protein
MPDTYTSYHHIVGIINCINIHYILIIVILCLCTLYRKIIFNNALNIHNTLNIDFRVLFIRQKYTISNNQLITM